MFSYNPSCLGFTIINRPVHKEIYIRKFEFCETIIFNSSSVVVCVIKGQLPLQKYAPKQTVYAYRYEASSYQKAPTFFFPPKET